MYRVKVNDTLIDFLANITELLLTSDIVCLQHLSNLISKKKWYSFQSKPCQLITFGTVLPHGYIIKCYKNASRVNRYNFPTVNAIDFLFSTLADATKSDTPWGSKPPHLQLGEFKSLQIQYLRTGVLLLLMCSVRKLLLYPSWRYSWAKLMHLSRSIAPF